jgi:hypothetical protein
VTRQRFEELRRALAGSADGRELSDSLRRLRKASRAFLLCRRCKHTPGGCERHRLAFEMAIDSPERFAARAFLERSES